jgi:myo-inositol 2-dehydrogenase / D-chiro-inositol 1-dehydrogenase
MAVPVDPARDLVTRLGVGFIGAGLVTQAIHLPALATLADRFRVVRVMDVDERIGSQVADRAGARFCTTAAELLADPEVELVAVCSPHQFHADQLIATCAAGKRGVLCEKPLATTAEQATAIAQAAVQSAVPVLVGAMHAYDPALVEAMQAGRSLLGAAHLVRSTIYLPPNDVMIEQATNPLVPSSRPAAAMTERQRAESTIRNAVLGLATHHISLVRAYAPAATQVRYARAVAPWGYDIVLTGGGSTVQLTSMMGGQWAPDWRLEAWGQEASVHVAFPPSYVLAGSARAEYRDSSGTRSWAAPDDGYQNEWNHLADVAEGRCRLRIPVTTAIEDLEFALRLADDATAMALAALPAEAEPSLVAGRA